MQLFEVLCFLWYLSGCQAILYHPFRTNEVQFSPEVSQYWQSKSMNYYRDTTFNNSNQVFNYSTTKVYGVNIGGWLLTEPFITPSLYIAAKNSTTNNTTPIDEYHYCKQLGTEECHKRLKNHWETFITEEDFSKIKSWGFNTVRIPIGYWAFAHRKSDPFCFGQEEYLENAINWCRKYGLHMWIDLHGMPGSQNGFDNSGLRDHLDWLNVTSNYNLGMEVLYYIQDKYGQPEYNDAVSGIENLNEPKGPKINLSKLKTFQKKSYSQQRSTGSDNYFIFHDSFMKAGYWNDIISDNSDISDFTNLTRSDNVTTFEDLTRGNNGTKYNGTVYRTVIDHHRYEVFGTGQLSLNIKGHITSLENYVQQFLDDETAPIKVIGEWSAALTDCAKWLNGVGTESRLEGKFESNNAIGKCTYSNNYTEMTAQNKTDTRKLVEAQLDLYNKTNGFIFWTYKTEDTIEWDLSRLIEHDLFPQPLTDRKYKDLFSNAASSNLLNGSSLLKVIAAIGVLIITNSI